MTGKFNSSGHFIVALIIRKDNTKTWYTFLIRKIDKSNYIDKQCQNQTKKITPRQREWLFSDILSFFKIIR